MSRYTTPLTLLSRGLEIFNAICVTKDVKTLIPLLSPGLRAFHDDHPAITSRDDFLAYYSQILTMAPNFKAEVLDHVVQVDEEGGGGKVWIFARLSGLPGGGAKESVDMMVIDSEGLLVRTKDVQRGVEGQVSR